MCQHVGKERDEEDEASLKVLRGTPGHGGMLKQQCRRDARDDAQEEGAEEGDEEEADACPHCAKRHKVLGQGEE